ncbi:MAG: hypothetical protein Tsb009_14650 [Planctomycetaceae bacterium]
MLPVPLNRGNDVEVGFRGETHPALAEQSLELKATCSAVGKGRGFKNGYFPEQFRGPFDRFSVQKPYQKYNAHDLSVFFPIEFKQPGQIWEIEKNRLTKFFKQFHSGASMELAAPGRRAGPNGAFGVLRAVSDTHYDVLLRVHAEFVLAEGMYLTPAYYEGRMLINRKEKRVDSFTLAIPTEMSLNVTLTAVLPEEALIDIIHLDRMELAGGKPDAFMQPWPKEIALSTARMKLKKTFYKFLDIQWVKPENALAEAKKQNRPILAVVMWGDLDDQSC